MLRFLVALLLLGSTAARPSLPTLCRVAVTSAPGLLLDKVLTVQLRPGCSGIAHLRLASSLGGSVPDNPPGRYTLRPRQLIRREVPAWWWWEWRDRSGRWWRVPETREDHE